MEKSFYLEKDWFKEKLVKFPFSKFLGSFGFTFLCMKDQEFSEKSPWNGRSFNIYFLINDSTEVRKIEISLYPERVEVGFINEIDSILCESLAEFLHDYLIEQEECPLRFAMFGHVKADFAALPF